MHLPEVEVQLDQKKQVQTQDNQLNFNLRKMHEKEQDNGSKETGPNTRQPAELQPPEDEKEQDNGSKETGPDTRQRAALQHPEDEKEQDKGYQKKKEKKGGFKRWNVIVLQAHQPKWTKKETINH